MSVDFESSGDNYSPDPESKSSKIQIKQTRRDMKDIQSTGFYKFDVNKHLNVVSEKSEVLNGNEDYRPNLSSEMQITNVPKSTGSKCKQHFCPYCKKLQTKFARHIELVHQGESDVKKMISLPKGIVM